MGGTTVKDMIRAALLCGILAAAPALADVIVHEGVLEGGGEPHYQDFYVPQFDDLGGARMLNFVQLDFLTSIIGGCDLDGSGGTVQFYARLDADYYLGDELLANTWAMIRVTMQNDWAGSPCYYDTDEEQTIIDQAAEMAPWIGDGLIMLTAFTEFVFDVDPPDLVGCGVGGSVHYSVTYNYDVVGPECPGDLDTDLDIDLQDLAVLLANYGILSGATYQQGDIDADGDVDLSDLSALLAVYGTTCE
jgi:hypothetical protein